MGFKIENQRFALILSREESGWESCQVIVPNLYELYRQSFPHAELEIFNYQEEMGHYEYFCMLKRLLLFSPDKIIICDHKPHPKKLIRDLTFELGEKMPPLYCHLFGDFSLYTVQWLELETYLQQSKIRFIAASDRQENFVKQFIDHGDKFVSYLPFPVDDKRYRFSSKHRKEARRKLQWGDSDEKRFLYTGRLSQQKNIIPLMESFKSFLTLSGSGAHLYIAGGFDDLGYPFFGQYPPRELYYYQCQEYLEKNFKGSLEGRVHFVGRLSGEELCDYYQACDVFVSMSLHNDEDFGMSPAEALCCGMPLILSDWGGYPSFCLPGTPCDLVDVFLENAFFDFNSTKLVKLLMKHREYNMNNKERSKLSLAGRKRFSIRCNVKRLLDIHNKPLEKFSHWNQKFRAFADCFEKNSSNPFGTVDTSVSAEDLPAGEIKLLSRKIYRECYREYVAGP